MRPLCKCGLRPRAVNYKKNNKTYYRSLDGKWGEIYWTTAYDKDGAYEYLQKTEKDFGEKEIFI